MVSWDPAAHPAVWGGLTPACLAKDGGGGAQTGGQGWIGFPCWLKQG